MPESVDAAAVRRWCAAGLEALRRHQPEIDALNVYPVPDGDTGTNLALTMSAATAAVDAAPTDLDAGALLRVAARGALLGARGNSGIILAQLLKGLAESLAGVERIGGPHLAAALTEAARLARAAVAAPVEGTVLSVASAAAAAAASSSSSGMGVVAVVHAAAQEARAALARTPAQLPELARAGVVDAGGRGLVVLLDALWSTVTGTPVAELPAGRPRWSEPVMAQREAGSAEFGYEVQYLLDAPAAAVGGLREVLSQLGDSLVIVGDEPTWHVHVHVNDVGAAIEAGLDVGRPSRIAVTRFADQIAARDLPVSSPPAAAAPQAAGRSTGAGRTGPELSEPRSSAAQSSGARWSGAGSSGLVEGGSSAAGDSSAGRAVRPAATAGPDTDADLVRPALAEMTKAVFGVGSGSRADGGDSRGAQADGAELDGSASGRFGEAAGKAAAVGDAAVVGEGPVVGAAAVVVVCSGLGLGELLAAEGATVVSGMPSTAEILDAIRATGARRVVVLPNDRNVLGVANAAAAEARAGGVRAGVVPTRSPVQALAAMAVRDAGRRFEDDVIAMAEAAARCRSAELTVAAREALTVAGRCQPGDVLAIVDGEVNLIGRDLAGTACQLLDRMLAAGGELVTLLTGREAPAGLGELLRAHVGQAWPFVEVQCYEGGQPHYPLLVGVE